jgi:hypothetical protein
VAGISDDSGWKPLLLERMEKVRNGQRDLYF